MNEHTLRAIVAEHWTAWPKVVHPADLLQRLDALARAIAAAAESATDTPVTERG